MQYFISLWGGRLSSCPRATWSSKPADLPIGRVSMSLHDILPVNHFGEVFWARSTIPQVFFTHRKWLSSGRRSSQTAAMIGNDLVHARSVPESVGSSSLPRLWWDAKATVRTPNCLFLRLILISPVAYGIWEGRHGRADIPETAALEDPNPEVLAWQVIWC